MSMQQGIYDKEQAPNIEVENLKATLKSLGIDIVEEWLNTGVIGTYSLNLRMKDTQLGIIGKGLTKESAQIRAYVKFFERYQNNWLARCHMMWKSKYNFNYYVDEIKMSSEEIAEQDNAFLNMYFKLRGVDSASKEEKAAVFRKVQKLDYKLFSEKDCYIMLPFYSARKGSVDYLPFNTYSLYYNSNGMCAGNTEEDALCQGLSDILKRVVQKKLFFERPALPDIPDKFISNYPRIKELLTNLKATSKEYTLLLKDCSFGGKYPVAALIIIDKNTGRYEMNLGCHPDYGIAMERAFTEASEGNDKLFNIDKSVLDFDNKRILDDYNILNSFSSGKAQVPYELLLDHPSYEFVPVKNVSGMTDKEIVIFLINEILKDGYDILIRNVSYLGIPSFHIIIPGLSEVFNMTDSRFETYNTKFHVMQLLNTPDHITKENCSYVLEVLDSFSSCLSEKNMRAHYGVLTNFEVPGEDVGMGWLYLSAMCLVLKGEYLSAAARMKLLLSKLTNVYVENVKFYRLVYYYLSGMVRENNHGRVIKYLKNFFDTNLCAKLEDIFINPEEVIVKQYPKHDFQDKDNCKIKLCCDYYSYAVSVEKFKDSQIRKPIKQELLKELFDK